jgi:hypothetical protein
MQKVGKNDEWLPFKPITTAELQNCGGVGHECPNLIRIMGVKQCKLATCVYLPYGFG